MLQIFLKFISGSSSKITAAPCKRNLCTTTVSLRKSRKIITRIMMVNSALQRISNRNDK